jgi:multiple sugar transport system permease protein
LIGTWQVFDQIYVMGKGAPAGTTITPAFLSYKQSFTSLKYGSGAAMAFIVFLIIVILTFFQRRVMAEDRKRGRIRKLLGSRPPDLRGPELAGTATAATLRQGGRT